jgi:hypothetical protein
MVSQINYKVFNAIEDFVIVVTSKLITCLIDNSRPVKFQSTAYSRNGYSNLNLEGEVHCIWDLWTGGADSSFRSTQKILNLFWGAATAPIHLPLEAPKRPPKTPA